MNPNEISDTIDALETALETANNLGYDTDGGNEAWVKWSRQAHEIEDRCAELRTLADEVAE